MLASSAIAQQRKAASAIKIEEDHAGEAMEWLAHFINPMGDSNYTSLKLKGYEQFRAMNNGAAMKVTSSAAWTEVGKSQDGTVSGRPSGIAFTPDGTIYLATTNGGLWKSQVSGQSVTWTSLSDTWEMLPTGGVAVNPENPNTVYAGTGIYLSGIGGGGDINGLGVYKSYDGGLNWELLDSSSSLVTTQMEVNPADTNLIYRATTNGVRVSTDGGLKWSNDATLNGATNLVFDPNNPAILYAGGGTQVEKSTDSGLTWVALSGFPTGQGMSLAMSQSSSDTLYLSTGYGYYGNLTSSSSTLAMSPDGGKTWLTQSTAVKYTGTQAYYDNAIAVSPQNPATVIVGGLDIYHSTRSGQSLGKLTDWTTSSKASNYTHADIHVLKYNPYTAVLYALTDGGIFYSATNGLSWKQDLNNDLGTLLFVGGDMAVDPNSQQPLYFAAGAQDNGFNRLTFGDQNYVQMMGGDGGTAYISPSDNETVFGTYTNASLYKSGDGGTQWQGSGANLLSGTPIDPNSGGEDAPFYMEYDVADQDPNVIAICGNRNLFLSQDGGQGFPDFPQVTNVAGETATTKVLGNVSTVHIAKANDQNIYLGTTGPRFYYSLDQGTTWTQSTNPTGFSGTPMGITTDPNNENHVYMVTAGVAATSKHFYVSTDNGQDWTSPATNLPNLTYRRVAVDDAGIIYIGNDYGVLRSGDGGVTWYPVADGLPMTMVTGLRVRGQYLLAVTYGRGMYYVDLSKLPPVPSSAGLVASSGTPSSGIAISAVYPNIINAAAPQTSVDYSLTAGNQTTLAVYDVLGRQERILVNQFASQGDHEVRADLAGLAPGQHYFVLTSSGVSVTKPITIE